MSKISDRMTLHPAPQGVGPEQAGGRGWRRYAGVLRGAAAAMAVAFALFAPTGSGVSPYAAAAATAVRHGQQYGVIEIGAKGVKAYVFDLAYAQTGPGCNSDPEVHLKCLNEITLDQINVNPVERESMQRTVDAIVEMHRQLNNQYNVPDANLYVVGSSGIYDSEHRPELTELVNRTLALGPDKQMDYISKDEEALYAFKGVMAMLPRPWNVKRRTEALVIDFGSGNTKGSFSDTADYSRPLSTFAVPWGTKTATDRINVDRGASGDFTQTAEKFRETTLVPLIRKEFDNEAAAMSRPRVYIIGGMAWALSNLTRPGTYRLKFPPVTQADIDALYARVVAPNAFASLCDANRDAQIDPDIPKVCKTFTIDNLVAGMQIMRGYAREMDFAHKHVFFFRDSLYAWPMGYLEHKVYPDAAAH